jgi:DNA-binding response OmpR family regulator
MNPSVPTPHPQPPRRLLLVEDEPSTAVAMAYLLRRNGFDVVLVGSVHDALSALGQPAAFDHIVLDLMLPDGDGASVLAHLRAGGLHVPVTVTSAVSDPDRLARVRALGARNVLRKPLEFADLLEALGAQ